MDGKRIKIVLIFLLLAVDILLAVVVGGRSNEAAAAKAQTARDTVAALETLGATVSENTLVEQPAAIYTMEEERNAELEFTVFSALIGASAQDFAEIGSGIYQAQTERGTVRISNAGLFEAVLNNEQDGAYTNDFNTSAADLRDDVQYIENAPVFNRTISYVHDNGTSTISGGLLLGEVYVIDATPSKSAEAVLLMLAGLLYDGGESLGTVASCELGYLAELAASGFTTLRPVWRIQSDEGEWYVDAIALSIIG